MRQGEAIYNPTAIVRDIVSYRTATKASVKDVLLYRIGTCLELFTPEEKQAIAQQNRRLNDWQRQQVTEVLFDRFGVTLS